MHAPLQQAHVVLSPRARVGVASLASILLAVDVIWCRSVFPGGFGSLNGYVGSAALLLIAVVGLSAVVTPSTAWRALAIVYIMIVGCGSATVLGMMFASCDAAMRPFLVEMLLLFPMTILLQATGILALIMFCALAALAASGLSKVFGSRVSTRSLIYAVASVPVVFLLTAAGSWMAGVHPVAGNCVL